MNSFLESISTIALAVIGLAIVAVIVSRNSNAVGLVRASASGLANNIGVAISPVTGASYTPDLSYGSGFGGF
jgi:hypothetical protein